MTMDLLKLLTVKLKRKDELKTFYMSALEEHGHHIAQACDVKNEDRL